MSVQKFAAALGTLILALALVSAVGAAQSPEIQPLPQPAWDPASVQVIPAGNAITYQGYLTDGGLPANGVYDFAFTLYADAAGTVWVTDALSVADLPVVDGYFTARVDFSDAMYGDVHFHFNGEARWLKISVRPGASIGIYTPLAPLQALTPAPYAQALPGLHTIQNDTSPNVVGGYPWNSVNVNAVGGTIAGGGSQAGANAVNQSYGTVGGGHHNVTGGQYATVAGGSENTAVGFAGAIAGGEFNVVSNTYAAVAGGYDNEADGPNAFVGGGTSNIASGTNGAICGGNNNRAAGYAFVGGGSINEASGSSSTVGGGGLNTAAGQGATIAGGTSNNAAGVDAAIGGGEGNSAGMACAAVAGGCGNVAAGIGASVAGGGVNYANAQFSSVGGGSGNTANGQYSTVPGGADNSAAGIYSLAAGRRAKANHTGTFVWADATDADFTSTEDNQFLVRATGGAEITANSQFNGLVVDNDGAPDNGDGLRAYAYTSKGSNWAAVFAVNSGTSPAVYANSAGTYAGYFMNDIYVAGNCVGCTLVYMARNDGTEPLEEGDLVVATGVTNLAGSDSPVLSVRRAAAAGEALAVQEAIAGVVLARGVLETSLAKEPAEGGAPVARPTEDVQRAEGPAAPGDYLFLVVQGIARVKVDASAGAIAAGQRLAAASMGGHARALRTVVVEGLSVAEGVATLGIALESLETGTGLISVLVNLQ